MSEPSGFLVVNKPAGVTSHDVVAFARRRFKTTAVGHAGTLDPLAVGVLILGIGQATRLLEYLVGCDKEYSAELTLGATSTTYDAEGELTSVSDRVVTRDECVAALPRFIGTIAQVPPVYSAIKIAGKTAHARVRAGEEIEMQSRMVTIHDIALTRFAFPKIEINVSCGSGTYIRSLAHDLGAALGVGAYLSRLTRIRAGNFRLTDGVTLHNIDVENLLPLDVAVAKLPRVSLTRIEAEKIAHGQKIPARTSAAGSHAAYADGRLVAIVEPEIGKGSIRPVKVLA